MPFGKWSGEQVCEWLEEIGLGQYVVIARHWVASGQTLLSATPQDLERVYFCEMMLLMHLSGRPLGVFHLSLRSCRLSVFLAFSHACLRFSTCRLVLLSRPSPAGLFLPYNKPVLSV